MAGTTGIYACEPQGIDSHRAATAALQATTELATSLTANVTPVVLYDSDEHPHQLQISNGQRAWALPIKHASALITRAQCRGLTPAQIKRIRRPAPGWEYLTENDKDGWTYRVRYDSHDT